MKNSKIYTFALGLVFMTNMILLCAFDKWASSEDGLVFYGLLMQWATNLIIMVNAVAGIWQLRELVAIVREEG